MPSSSPAKRRPPTPLPPRDGATWLTPREAAFHLGVSVATLARWRVHGTGPAFHRPRAGCVRYDRATLDSWLGEAATSTSDRALRAG